MVRLGTALLALFSAGLAGCFGGSGGSPAPDAAGDATPTGDADSTLAVPAWAVGDWWNYTSDQIGAYTLVVTEDAGTDYAVGTDNGGMAFYDARFDVSNLGPQRKSDLAGSQGSTRVEFFHWPLSDGLSWTTTWDGQPVTVTAAAGPKGRFTMTAENATGPYAAYTYDSDVRWVTEWHFFAPDGSMAFESRLQSSGTGYTGVVRSWELDLVVDEAGALQPGARQGTFPVEAGITDVYAEYFFHCTAGVLAFTGGAAVVFDNERGFSEAGPCPLEAADSRSLGTHELEGQDETWGYSIAGDATIQGEFSLQMWKRTLVETPVGTPSA